jgi:hypothetical protein
LIEHINHYCFNQLIECVDLAQEHRTPPSLKMTSHSLLPSVTLDIGDNNELPVSNVSTLNEVTQRNPEMQITDDDDVAQELRDDSSLRDEAETGTSSPPNNSILGDFSLFRDFFLAAFSDGCYKVCRKSTVGFVDICYCTNQTSFRSLIQVSCCGTEGLFPGSCISQRRAREISNTDSFGNGSDRGEAQSLHATDLNMNRTGSYEGVVVGPQRTRPLAVAVGFKYAEDMNGRPIVITAGSRRGAMQSQPSSPASQSIHTKKFDIVSNVLFPVDNGPEA